MLSKEAVYHRENCSINMADVIHTGAGKEANCGPFLFCISALRGTIACPPMVLLLGKEAAEFLMFA